MRTIKRAVVASTAVVVIAGVITALPAIAGGSGAQKAPLEAPGFGSCTQGANDGSPSQGFVVTNVVGSQIIAVISLKGALPNTTYNVGLFPTNICPSFDGFTTITTNGQGNGTGHITAPLSGGTYFVYGETGTFFSGANRFASPAVTVT